MSCIDLALDPNDANHFKRSQDEGISKEILQDSWKIQLLGLLARCNVLPGLVVAGSNLRQDIFPTFLKRSYPGSGTPHFILVRITRGLHVWETTDGGESFHSLGGKLNLPHRNRPAR